MKLSVGGDKQTYTPAPAGIHAGVCVDFVDLGMVTTAFNGETKTKPMIRFIYELVELNPETGKRWTVAQRYTASLHKKSNLFKLLVGWFGKAPQDGQEIDLEKLVGQNCTIIVAHNDGPDGTVFANITAIAPADKGREKMTPSKDFIRTKDRPAKTENEEAFREATIKPTPAAEMYDNDPVPF